MALKISELRNYCTNSTQRLILDLLKKANKNCRVRRSELVDLLHMDDTSIRSEIQSMRANGIPVASDMKTAGYYLPKTWQEFVEFSANYTGRAFTIIKANSAMVKTAQEMLSGQERIDLNG